MKETGNGVTWTKAKIYALITLYNSEPSLWNSGIEEYKSREKRDIAITKICDQLDINRAQFSKKVHNLRNQFNYEAKKVFKRNSDSKDSYKSKWEFYDSLKFLKNVIAPRPGFSSLGFDDMPYATTQINNEAIKKNTSSPKKKNNRKNSAEQTEIEDTSLSHEDHIEKIFSKITSTKVEPQNNIIDVDSRDEELPIAKKQKLSNSNNANTSPTNSSGRNEYEVFGEFIGTELKNLRSESSRRILKRKIMQAILEVSIADDAV